MSTDENNKRQRLREQINVWKQLAIEDLLIECYIDFICIGCTQLHWLSLSNRCVYSIDHAMRNFLSFSTHEQKVLLK